MGDQVIAVFGGGQLGRMLALAATPLGARCRFVDPKPDAPAADVGHLTAGELDDADALWSVARGASVATYEWEGVSADAVRSIEGRVPVRPGSRALAASQDRLAEKELFRSLGIAVAPFRVVDSEADLAAAYEALGRRCVCKTRSGGYDGKGQAVITSTADLGATWELLGGQPLLLEAHVAFERELSVVATRGSDGQVRVFPITENVHSEGILRWSRPDLECPSATVAAATSIVTRVLDALDYVGTIAIELFDTAEGLLANELAPRVHNSGHWTIDGAATSQFENHIRAVLDLPLGETHATAQVAMVNCLGAMPDAAAVLAIPGAHLHDYRKAPRPGRKVGHVTLVADDRRTLDDRLDTALALVGAPPTRRSQ